MEQSTHLRAEDSDGVLGAEGHQARTAPGDIVHDAVAAGADELPFNRERHRRRGLFRGEYTGSEGTTGRAIKPYHEHLWRFPGVPFGSVNRIADQPVTRFIDPNPIRFIWLM